MTTRDAYIAAENGEEVPVYNEDDRRPEVGTLVQEMRAIPGVVREPQPAFQPLVILIDDNEDDEDDDEDYENYDDDEDEELNFEVYGDGGNGWVDEI